MTLTAVLTFAAGQFGAVAGPPAFGAAASNGSGDLLAKSNHVHGLPALPMATTVVAPTTYGAASTPGASTNLAKEDHSHGTPALSTAAPLALGAAAAGAGTLPSKDTHVHPTTGLALLAGANVFSQPQQMPHLLGSTTGPTVAFTSGTVGNGVTAVVVGNDIGFTITFTTAGSGVSA